MSSSIFRRLISHKISRSCIFISPPHRKFFWSGSGGDRKLPWLMLPPSSKKRWLPPCFGKGGQLVYNFYNPFKGKVVSFNNRGGKQDARALQDARTKLVGSSHGWLAWSNTINRYMFLSNPLSGRRIELPPVDYGNPSKVILSCSPNEEDCHALVILPGEDRVAFCRPGRSSHWTLLEQSDDRRRIYKDFVYFPSRKSFVGFAQASGSSVGDLEYWNVDNPLSPKMVGTSRLGWADGGDGDRDRDSYLVLAMDRLYLVRRFLDKRQFLVYEIDCDGRGGGGILGACWTLGDLAMFVGINHSFAVKASSRFPKLKPDSIYFGASRYGYLNDDVHTFDSLSHHLPWFTPSFD